MRPSLPGLPLLQEPGSFWMPPQASAEAPGVDSVFYYILYVSIFFFLLIVALMTVFVFRYRRRRTPEGVSQAQPSPTHNLRLEIAWTVVPILVVISIFYFGFRAFLNINTPPRDSYEIQVTAQKWQWFFTYPNGHVSEELHVPIDVPIRLVMTSEDVIHSLFVPAFRIKKDAVPGRYTVLWFTPREAGQYELLCAEYCGTGHSDMLTWVVVHEPGGFERWLVQAAEAIFTLSPVDAGERLFRTRGCRACHSVDGSGSIGPTLKDLFGATRPLAGGGSATADENYLRESLLDPQARIVAGFEPVMPTYQGRLSDREITAIISYVKSLSEAGRAALESAPPDSAAAGGAPAGADTAAAAPDTAAVAPRSP